MARSAKREVSVCALHEQEGMPKLNLLNKLKTLILATNKSLGVQFSQRVQVPYTRGYARSISKL